MADDDIDLNALNDEELVEQMWDDLYDGLADEVVEGVNILLARKWTPYDVLTKALVEGMRIVGMSALLTTTMPYMKVVIDTLKEQGIRDDYVVLVGGAPLNEEFAREIGADAYCRDAAVAVETAKDFMRRKHNQAGRATA